MGLKVLINDDGFLVITCEAGELSKEIHNRMPLIVDLKDINREDILDTNKEIVKEFI
jgi:putative SOS response-associated peptidase YedK